MTLVETVVMIVLVVIFGSIAYPVITNTISGIRRNQEFARQFEVGWTALGDLSAHVRQITAQDDGQAPLVGEDGGAGPGAHDRLILQTISLANVKAGSRCTVEYFVEDAVLETGLPSRLLRRSTSREGAVNVAPVGERVVGFDCAYLADGEWRAEWTGPGLPEAVRLTLHVIPRVGARARALFTEVTVTGGAA